MNVDGIAFIKDGVVFVKFKLPLKALNCAWFENKFGAKYV